MQPTVNKHGQRASGLKFGDPLVMALMLVLCQFASVIQGLRNRELRQQMAALLAGLPKKPNPTAKKDLWNFFTRE